MYVVHDNIGERIHEAFLVRHFECHRNEILWLGFIFCIFTCEFLSSTQEISCWFILRRWKKHFQKIRLFLRNSQEQMLWELWLECRRYRWAQTHTYPWHWCIRIHLFQSHAEDSWARIKNSKVGDDYSQWN